MPHMLRDNAGGRPVDSALSDDQFEELKAMLQPGFELSTLMLADYLKQHPDLKSLKIEHPHLAPRIDAHVASALEAERSAKAAHQDAQREGERSQSGAAGGDDVDAADRQRDASAFSRAEQIVQSTHTARDAAGSPESPSPQDRIAADARAHEDLARRQPAALTEPYVAPQPAPLTPPYEPRPLV